MGISFGKTPKIDISAEIFRCATPAQLPLKHGYLLPPANVRYYRSLIVIK